MAIAEANLKSAGVARYVDLSVKPLSKWDEAPLPPGVIVTNPPYGERISAPDMDGLYETIGNKLKRVFTGYTAWIIGYRDEYFRKIGLSASRKIPMFNGSLECELREYIIFDGDKKSFLASGGKLKEVDDRPKEPRRMRDRRDDRFAERTRDSRRDKRSDRRFDDRFDDRRRDSRRDRKNDRRRDFSRDFDSSPSLKIRSQSAATPMPCAASSTRSPRFLHPTDR